MITIIVPPLLIVVFSATECVPAPVLGSASSKFRAGTGTEYATVIEYTCDKGYEISGPPIIICREDGEWSNETMICNSE